MTWSETALIGGMSIALAAIGTMIISFGIQSVLGM